MNQITKDLDFHKIGHACFLYPTIYGRRFQAFSESGIFIDSWPEYNFVSLVLTSCINFRNLTLTRAVSKIFPKARIDVMRVKPVEVSERSNYGV
ncbi:MAG: hypothetical protein SVO01_00440 [Thermotogota bacterium]|nr:hypothetical protein [Thermotogota bacterium]